jgi:hypothetical protein
MWGSVSGHPKVKELAGSGMPGLNAGTAVIRSGACRRTRHAAKEQPRQPSASGRWAPQFACDSRKCPRIWRTLRRRRCHPPQTELGRSRDSFEVFGFCGNAGCCCVRWDLVASARRKLVSRRPIRGVPTLIGTPRHPMPPQQFPQHFWPGQRLASKPGSFGQGDAFPKRWRVAHASLGRGCCNCCENDLSRWLPVESLPLSSLASADRIVSLTILLRDPQRVKWRD